MPLTIILIHMTSKMTNNMSAQSFCDMNPESFLSNFRGSLHFGCGVF